MAFSVSFRIPLSGDETRKQLLLAALEEDEEEIKLINSFFPFTSSRFWLEFS